jgi:hypothetical protein
MHEKHDQETNGFGGRSGKHKLDIMAAEEKQILQELRVKLGLQRWTQPAGMKELGLRRQHESAVLVG